MVYLDYAASTPVNDEVLETYNKLTKEYFANPNSNHKLGKRSKELIDEYTKDIALKLGVLPEELIYTSGATESNNLAIKGVCERYKSFGKHILISALEHNSIVASAVKMQSLGFEVEVVPVRSDGLIDIEALKKMIRDDTILVSICSVDSEIGLIQPIDKIKEVLKDYPHCLLHTDATQGFGKINLDLTIPDLVTLAPHKFYGLTGMGLLIKRKEIGLVPQIDGGKSTTIYRAGTPELPSIGALDKAIEMALKNIDNNYNYVEKLNILIKNNLKQYKNVVINSRDNSLPFTINFSIKNVKSLKVVESLEDKEIYVSAKTSCCPIESPSKLVYALTKDKNIASTAIRVSLSHLTRLEEVEVFLREFDSIYKSYYKD